MKELEIKIKKYQIKRNKKTYNIYVNENIKENITEFYVNKEGYGVIFYQIGVDLKELKQSIEDFIKFNINDWIFECETLTIQ